MPSERRKTHQTARKIAIVGTSNTAPNAPYDDPAWEIWACSIGNKNIKRADRWFEMHELSAMQAMYPDWLPFLAEKVKAGIPVYVPEPSEALPGIRFPIESMIEQFGGDAFFTSAICYMLALALHESKATGNRDIGLWGIEAAREEELYAYQREGILFYLQAGRMLGFNFTMPVDCALLRPNALYGYLIKSKAYAMSRKRLGAIEERMAMTQKTLDTLNADQAESRGFRAGLAYALSWFAAGDV